MQPPGAGKPCLQRGVEQGKTIGEQAAGEIHPQILPVAFGRYPDPSGEGALKMRRAHTHLPGQILKRQRIALRLDQGKGAGDDTVMIGRAFGVGQGGAD